MAALEIPYYTYEDYKKWQRDWELIKDIPYAMAPSVSSQFVSGKIFRELDEKLDVKFSEDTILRPDVAIFCHPIVDYSTRAPKIVFEVGFKNSVSEEIIEFDFSKIWRRK